MESGRTSAPGPFVEKVRRVGSRTRASLAIEVEGRGGRYSGQAVDLSANGALIRISDEKFASSSDAKNMVRFGERVQQEFRDAMRLHFTRSGVVRDCEVIRVARSKAKGKPLLVACHFLHSLSKEDCDRMEIEFRDKGAVAKGPKPKPKRKAKWAPPADTAQAEVEVNTGERQKERRKAPRVGRIYYAMVNGEAGQFKAHILNLSHSGALISISDPALAAPKGPDELVLYTKRLGIEFRNGMLLRILEGEVSVQAGVVRVSEKTQGSETLVVIGIQFRRSLTPDECERLEIRAPSIAAGAMPPTEPNPYTGKTRIRELMTQAMQGSATDLHIKVGSPPRLRMRGVLVNLGNQPVTHQQSHGMALELMTHEQAARFECEGDTELAFTIENVGRFRVNVLRQRGTTGLVIRCIPDKVPTIAELNLNPLSATLAERPRGLVLVTGPTGSGKSTTLAALVNHINHTRACHIITMEDPIEYLHTDAKAHITQREIGRDALDFEQALKRALRQDPDVIMVGEMRDIETISLALTAAETGHLVFGTLHTTSAVLTPDRIVDVFPFGQQPQVRMQLADTLQGVMAQMLLPRRDGTGMVVAQEVLVATEAIRALIRERKTPQIINMMQTGAKEGMLTLEAALNDLVRKGIISYEMAVSKAYFPKQIRPREEQK